MVTVWRDDGDSTNNNRTPITEEKVVEDFDLNLSSTSTGMFDKLKPGDDYTLDARRGLLFFKGQVFPQAVIAIDYQFVDNDTYLSELSVAGALKLVKTPTTPRFFGISAGTAHRREIKTFFPGKY